MSLYKESKICEAGDYAALLASINYDVSMTVRFKRKEGRGESPPNYREFLEDSADGRRLRQVQMSHEELQSVLHEVCLLVSFDEAIKCCRANISIFFLIHLQ